MSDHCAVMREFAAAVKQLCKDFSDRQNRPYMGDVTAAIDGLYEQFSAGPTSPTNGVGCVERDGYEPGGIYERAYATGYRAALGAASAECRRLGEALDNGNNTYVRYPDAIKCAVAISGLRVPSDDGAKRQCECPDGPYHYSSCPEYTGADPFAALGRAMTK